MLAAIVEGEEDPKVLANLAKGQLRHKRSALEEALQGLVGPHQRLLLATQLRHLDFLDQEIGRLDAEVAQRLSPFEAELEAVDTIPGIARRGAEAILAEMGTDMSRFATPAHLASWAGVCPGNNRSAGKRRRSPTKGGNVWLQSTLVEAARAAARTRTYLGAQYHRLAARIGANRAAMAVAHSIAIILHSILRTKNPYIDLGANYFDQRDQQATLRRAVRRIERLGFKVSVEAL